MVSQAKRDHVRAMRLHQTWPTWLGAVGFLGLLSLPVTYFISTEAFLYSLALIAPLVFVLAVFGLLIGVTLTTEVISWLLKKLGVKNAT